MQQMCASFNSTYNLYYSKDKRGFFIFCDLTTPTRICNFFSLVATLIPNATATTFRDRIDFFDEEN